MRLRQPVKWIEDRRDNLTAAFLGREQHYVARGAFDVDGHLLALDTDVICDMGAYSTYPGTAAVDLMMASTEMPGVYKVPAYRIRARGIATNKAPSAAYRGVSRPHLRAGHGATHGTGRTQARARRRRRATAKCHHRFPYRGVNNITYDPGSYLESLNLCERICQDEGWFGLRESRRDAISGSATSVSFERTGRLGAFSERKMEVLARYDLSDITMDMTGAVRVTTGTVTRTRPRNDAGTDRRRPTRTAPRQDEDRPRRHRQDQLRFRLFRQPLGITIGGGAVSLAAVKLGEQSFLAAHLMEVDVASVELDGQGGVRVRNDPSKTMTFADLADVAYLQSPLLPKELEPGLRASASFDLAADGVFSNATHGVVVELDPGTGGVDILRYVCVEDVGVAINPKVVEGQTRGGIAQGIAGGLFEQVTYDSNGQPLAPTFMEYKVPTAMEIPDIRIEHLETPSALTESGAKGAGEGGTIGAPAAIVNAINDALRHTDVEVDTTPIPRELVFRALENAVRTPLEAIDLYGNQTPHV